MSDSLSINTGISMSQVANDPYFQMYMQQLIAQQIAQQNATAQTQTTTSQGDATAQAQTTTPISPTFNGLNITPDYSDSGNTQGISGGTIAAIGATALLATTALAAYKGGGLKTSQLKDGFKQIWSGTRNLFSKNANKIDDAAACKLKDLKIKMTESGPQYFIPGKTHNIGFNDAVKVFGEKEVRKLMELTESSTIKSGSFGVDDFIVKFKDGNISQILQKDGTTLADNIWKDGQFVTTSDDNIGKIIDAITSKLNTINSKNFKAMRKKDFGMQELTYTTTTGDNIAEVLINFTKEGKKAKLNNLTTLQPFTEADDVMKAYIYDHKLDVLKGLSSTSKVPKGFKIGRYELASGIDNTNIVANGNEILGIRIDGKLYPQGTEKFSAFMGTGDNNNNVRKMIEKALKDGNIPAGATLIRT